NQKATAAEQATEVKEEEKVKTPKKKKKNEWEEKYNAEHDQYLRLYAEYDNFRKRTARERDRLVGDGVAKAIEAILPAIDNLERAIAAAPEGEEGMKSGVEMVLRQLLDSLKNIGVTPIGEKGEKFDPNRHEAIMHIEDPELGEDEIVEVFQRGYVYKEETVIRPAVVKTVN
ncbi:MAG: nucleotide exchange factor GrpE, partial [Clostridia bacterium]|nr:nucleotide exchange factor GrpE [Clostridia bacterium]